MGDFFAEMEAVLEADEYSRLRDRLAYNDDCLLEALVTLRRVKGLTQEEVAGRMGRSKTAVSNFERLGADPHLTTIRRYAAAVGALIRTEVEDYDLVRIDLEPIQVIHRHRRIDVDESSDATVNEEVSTRSWDSTKILVDA
ncbi:helix-turn-helix transcriptional regulator [Gordonia cholesterolivorans]|uniref:HTH cro/C1-type domain-containing protein n=1 Tax=Gordonia cholesterolivorans TaxID=559625 RepID=A0ABN3HCR9_9ACTN